MQGLLGAPRHRRSAGGGDAAGAIVTDRAGVGSKRERYAAQAVMPIWPIRWSARPVCYCTGSPIGWARSSATRAAPRAVPPRLRKRRQRRFEDAEAPAGGVYEFGPGGMAAKRRALMQLACVRSPRAATHTAWQAAREATARDDDDARLWAAVLSVQSGRRRRQWAAEALRTGQRCRMTRAKEEIAGPLTLKRRLRESGRFYDSPWKWKAKTTASICAARACLAMRRRWRISPPAPCREAIILRRVRNGAWRHRTGRSLFYGSHKCRKDRRTTRG